MAKWGTKGRDRSGMWSERRDDHRYHFVTKMHADISQEDFNLTREIVLMLKRERLTNDELVPLKRLHGFLKERNLKEEQIKQLIDEFDTHFFKRKGVSTEEYVDTIINLSLISRKFNVPLEKVLDSVNKEDEKGTR